MNYICIISLLFISSTLSYIQLPFSKNNVLFQTTDDNLFTTLNENIVSTNICIGTPKQCVDLNIQMNTPITFILNSSCNNTNANSVLKFNHELSRSEEHTSE